MRLKIAIWHNLPSGGGKRALFDQVRGLVASGHHVEVWCPPSAARDFLPLAGLVDEHVVPFADESVPGWRRRWTSWIAAQARRMDEHCRRCAAQIGARDFDVLLVHPCRFFRASSIALYATVPTILYLQEPFRTLYEASPRLPWAAPSDTFHPLSPQYWAAAARDLAVLQPKRVQVRNERAWVDAFDQVLVNSLFSRESVLRAYGVDARVCPLGIDTAHFSPTGDAKERFVIGVGNLYENKRPLFAVQCVAAIPAAVRPPLVWVGNMGDVDEMVTEAARTGVDLTVRILVTDDELKSLLSRAAVMVYPSRLEPFGYAPLEANACGTPVVAIAEGGIRETIREGVNGRLIGNLDPADFASAILEFCDDLAHAMHFGQRARQHVIDAWSADVATRALEDELERVIARPSSIDGQVASESSKAPLAAS